MISITPDVSNALFAAILHSIWQGCVLALIFVAVSRHLRRSQTRYLLAMSLFIAAPVAFVGTFLHALSQLAGDVPQMTTTSVSIWPGVFAIAWCVGAGFVGGRFFCGWLWLRLVIIGRSVAVPARIEQLFEETKATIGIPARVGIRASAAIRSPMVTGVIRPMVLLPVFMLSGIPPGVLTTVFTHELLHLRRLDHIAVFIQAIGETLLFFHPAVRWLSAEARRAREYRCDDESIDQLGNRLDYARALLAIEETPGDPLVPALLMNGGELMNRIERILSDDGKPTSGRLHFSGMLVFASIALLAYSLSVGQEPEKDASADSAHALSITWLPPSVTQWSSMIEDAAARHDVPADVLALMLFVESHGEAEATSSAGARGLMQVMPKTGQMIARQRGIAEFETAQLFEPETSIDFGAWYLAQMMSRFADQPTRAAELAISAYNAGPVAVAAYLDGSQPLPAETIGYRDMLLSMLSEADEDRSLVLEGRKAELRQRLPAFKTPVAGRVSSPFGFVSRDKGIHKGVDIAAPMGAPVSAPIGGTVTVVGEDDARGKYVTVRHTNGVESHYYHLSKVAVAANTVIQTGDRLGSVGSSGNSSGPHLHFEVREFGESVSPALYGFIAD